MKVLLILLKNTDIIDEILTALVEVGVVEGGVIEAMDVAEILSEDVPLFIDLKSMLSSKRTFNKIIIGFCNDENELKDLKYIINDEIDREFTEQDGRILLLDSQIII